MNRLSLTTTWAFPQFFCRGERKHVASPVDRRKRVTTCEPSTAIIPAPSDMTDWKSIRDLQQRCESSLRQPRRRVVLDLRSVTGADSKLIAYLVFAVRKAAAKPRRLEIRPSRSVRSWAAVCRVEDLLRSSLRR